MRASNDLKYLPKKFPKWWRFPTGIEANRQVCPTLSEVTFGNWSKRVRPLFPFPICEMGSNNSALIRVTIGAGGLLTAAEIPPSRA